MIGQAPRDRAPRRDEARESAALKEEPQRHRIKAAWGPARVRAEVPVAAKAREQAGVVVEVAAKVAEKVAAIGSN